MADEKIVSFFRGTVNNYDKMPDDYYLDGRLFFATDSDKTYLYFNDGDDRYNVVPRLLSVVNGGTGKTTFASGEALIGNGAGAIGTRAITDKSVASTLSSTSTNLITERAIYFYKGSSSITTLGTITSGKWQGTTVAVGYGGTGKTTFTTNGILYGNANSALQVTAAGTQGQIFSANSSGVPSFATPTFTWDAGTSAGPTWKLTLQGKDYTAVIPSATKDNSGVVTNAAQTFAGDKTFNGTIISSSVRPRTRNTYTSGSSGYPWASVYSHDYRLYDTDQNQVGRWYIETKGAAASADGATPAVTGKSYLIIGNNKAASAANNSRGYLYIYGSTAYASILVSDASSSNKTVTIPNYTGNMVIGHTSAVNPTSATSYYMPFYYTDKQRLGSNNGIMYTTLEGTDAVPGYGTLVLGNNTSSGTAGNKYGAIQFYNTANESFTLRANPTNVTEATTNITDYSVYLPVPDAATAELVYHPVNTAVGNSNRPVYISTAGKPTVISSLAVSYGGTGKTTLTSNGILYGNGTSALNVTAAGTQGQIFSANSSGVPSFTSPTWTWTGGTTAGPTLSLNLHSKAWTTAAIPSASASASGIVTTGTQTFAGVKTFSNTTASTAYNKGAVVIGGGLGVAGNIYSNGSLNMTGTGTFGGDITVTGGDIYLGPSATDRVQMTYANDTLTITFIE
jgi:hypothetical protein